MQRVLTTEWIDGCKPTDAKSIVTMGLSKADVRYFTVATYLA